MCAKFNPGGIEVFVGTMKGEIYKWEIQTNAISPVGQHQAPVKDLYAFNLNNQVLLASGGFDGKVLFWTQ